MAQETQGVGSSSTPSASTEEPPLWQFVTKTEKVGTGGTWKFTCNFCKENRQGSYSRVKAHLLGIKGAGISVCKKVTMSEKTNMKKLDDAYEQQKVASKEKEVGLPCEANVGLKKRKTISNPIDDLKMWDIGGDTFDSMEDVGFLEFAELSLDDPDLENDLIDNI